MGAWITYGLGSENQNLPGFIAMCPGGYPIVSTQKLALRLSAGRVSMARTSTRSIPTCRKLIENIRNNGASPDEQRKQLDLVQRLNERHLAAHQRDAQLEARIQSFELAYRMQSEATDAFDVAREPKHVQDMYGPGTPARQPAHGPAAAGKGRAVYSDLERRRPAVGQPRQLKSSIASWPANGPGQSRLS